LGYRVEVLGCRVEGKEVMVHAREREADARPDKRLVLRRLQPVQVPLPTCKIVMARFFANVRQSRPYTGTNKTVISRFRPWLSFKSP